MKALAIITGILFVIVLVLFLIGSAIAPGECVEAVRTDGVEGMEQCLGAIDTPSTQFVAVYLAIFKPLLTVALWLLGLTLLFKGIAFVLARIATLLDGKPH